MNQNQLGRMSLALLQGYSSAEEEEEEEEQLLLQEEEEQLSSDDAVQTASSRGSYKPLFDPNPPSSSELPSAFHAFSQVSGPPQFLNNSVQEDAPREDVQQRWRHGGGRRKRKDNRDLPSGAVLESKAKLVGIHERVRTDTESKTVPDQSNAQGGKRVVTAGNPNAEDAAELFRICVRCGIPKTFTHGKGIVCPMCGDRPPAETDNEQAKKKGSAIKDKEKSKRMKGQSSHATWKSETEMQLRQQFD